MQTSSVERIEALTSKGLWTGETLCGCLSIQARERPEQLAVVDQPDRAEWSDGVARRLTFRQLEHSSDAMLLDLLDRGVRHGDRVMIQSPNVVELVVLYFALSKLGAVASPLPVQYGSHEISMLSNALNATWFVGLYAFRGANLAANGLFAVDSQHTIALGEDIGLRATDGLAPEEFERLTLYKIAHPVDANDIYSICWTSGTTGTPKGVPRSHNMWMASAHVTAVGSNYVPGDVLLNPFPMVNMSALGGFLFPAVRVGCTLVLHHPIDVAVYLSQIQSETVDFTIAPPALLNRLAKQPALWNSFSFPKLRAIDPDRRRLRLT